MQLVQEVYEWSYCDREDGLCDFSMTAIVRFCTVAFGRANERSFHDQLYSCRRILKPDLEQSCLSYWADSVCLNPGRQDNFVQFPSKGTVLRRVRRVVNLQNPLCAS